MANIRRVCLEGVPYIVEMQDAWALACAGYQPWGHDPWLVASLGPYFLAAEDDEGHVVGYTIAQHEPGNGPVPHVQVRDLYVTPGHEGQGIGAQLLRTVIAQAEADGHRIIRLKPVCDPTQMPRLEEFYRRHGFEWEDGRRDMMRLELDQRPAN